MIEGKKLQEIHETLILDKLNVIQESKHLRDLKKKRANGQNGELKL